MIKSQREFSEPLTAPTCEPLGWGHTCINSVWALEFLGAKDEFNVDSYRTKPPAIRGPPEKAWALSGERGLLEGVAPADPCWEKTCYFGGPLIGG